MVGFVAIGCNQLFLGPAGSAVIDGLPWLTQRLFAFLLAISAVAVLISLALKGRAGAYSERGGMGGCVIALGFYSANLPQLPDWATSLGFLFPFLCVGCAVRCIQVHQWIRRWR